MEKFDELLVKLDGLKLLQKSTDWALDIPHDIWSEYFDGDFKEVDSFLYVDKHRWYETSVSVVKIFNRYLGIRFITDLFSEQSDISDIDYTIKFFEMKPVTKITYERI